MLSLRYKHHENRISFVSQPLLQTPDRRGFKLPTRAALLSEDRRVVRPASLLLAPADVQMGPF
jgi:hypothetical protein